jgi:hypothetical protein
VSVDAFVAGRRSQFPYGRQPFPYQIMEGLPVIWEQSWSCVLQPAYSLISGITRQEWRMQTSR